jgi:hypothetical protein
MHVHIRAHGRTHLDRTHIHTYTTTHTDKEHAHTRIENILTYTTKKTLLRHRRPQTERHPPVNTVR